MLLHIVGIYLPPATIKCSPRWIPTVCSAWKSRRVVETSVSDGGIAIGNGNARYILNATGAASAARVDCAFCAYLRARDVLYRFTTATARWTANVRSCGRIHARRDKRCTLLRRNVSERESVGQACRLFARDYAERDARKAV